MKENTKFNLATQTKNITSRGVEVSLKPIIKLVLKLVKNPYAFKLLKWSDIIPKSVVSKVADTGWKYGKYLFLLGRANKENIKGVYQGYSRFRALRGSTLLTPHFVKSLETMNGLEDLDIIQSPHIPNHVKEQILYRLGSMRTDCVKKGECPCKCSTPFKQFEDRACELNCYPPMMDSKDWSEYKKDYEITLNTIKEGLQNYINITLKPN